jgi:hypothetical protein
VGFKSNFKQNWVPIRLFLSLILVSIWGNSLQEGIRMLQGWWEQGIYDISQFVLGYSFLFVPFGLGVYGLIKTAILLKNSKDKMAVLFPMMRPPDKALKDKEDEALEYIKKEYQKLKEEQGK